MPRGNTTSVLCATVPAACLKPIPRPLHDIARLPGRDTPLCGTTAGQGVLQNDAKALNRYRNVDPSDSSNTLYKLSVREIMSNNAEATTSNIWEHTTASCSLGSISIDRVVDLERMTLPSSILLPTACEDELRGLAGKMGPRIIDPETLMVSLSFNSYLVQTKTTRS